MPEQLLSTKVDQLVELVKKEPKPIKQLAKELELEPEGIDKWLVVLEEYGVLKVTYAGIEGTVRYIEKDHVKHDEGMSILRLKDVFVEKCKQRGLSYAQIKKVWFAFIQIHWQDIYQEFAKQAKSHGLTTQYKINASWNKFKQELETF